MTGGSWRALVFGGAGAALVASGAWAADIGVDLPIATHPSQREDRASDDIVLAEAGPSHVETGSNKSSATTTPPPAEPRAGANGLSSTSAETGSSGVLANPYGHDIELTVGLTFNSRDLGELPVTLTKEGRLKVHSDVFLNKVAPLLNDVGNKAVVGALAGRETFAPSDLRDSGIELAFDSSRLSLDITKIDPFKGVLTPLFPGEIRSQGGVRPANFSAFMNTNASATWTNGIGVQPYLELDGGVRLGQVVLDAEIDGQQPIGSARSSFDMLRRYTRLVIDQPEESRRFYVGDLAPLTEGDQGYVQMAGLGVARQKRVFDPYHATTLTSNQTLLLQHDATVDVLVNGILSKQLKLNAGSYNLNNLPLQLGSNNVEIRLHDVTGGLRSINIDTFVDTVDLDPGDYEYAAYVGVLAPQGLVSPQYTSTAAFTGYYRKAFLNRNIIGGGVQASKDVQVVNGEARFIVLKGARLVFQAAASHSDVRGSGGAFEASFEQSYERGVSYDSLSLDYGYTTANFTTLADLQVANPLAQNQMRASATYTRGHTVKWSSSVSFNYYRGFGTSNGAYSAQFFNDYRFAPKWRIRAGIEWDHGNNSVRNGVGVLVGLIWRPSDRTTAEVDADSLRRTVTASVDHSTTNSAGSLGYSGIVSHADGQNQITGTVDYIGNRFDGGVAVATEGPDVSNLADQRSLTIHAGTSFAFADGHLAVGRHIDDSFAIAYPHPSLRSRDVILGQDLEGGRYDAKSDALGPALYGRLQSYVTEELHYDVLNPPLGYNVGAGVAYLKPSYHSGYAIQVGGDAFISATGTLLAPNGQPIAYGSGRVLSTSDAKFTPQPFFTNSVGRFAIEDLKPGQLYRVEINSTTGASFEFKTPSNGDALVNLHSLTVQVPVE